MPDALHRRSCVRPTCARLARDQPAGRGAERKPWPGRVGGTRSARAEGASTSRRDAAATAHPFKFPDPICDALDIKAGATPYESLDNISAVTGVAFPKQLEALKGKKLRFTRAIDKEAMKDEILQFVDTFSK